MKTEIVKRCWQMENLINPTPCFNQMGGPCIESECLVKKRIEELTNSGVEIDEWWQWILPHSACRKSTLFKPSKINIP